MPPSTWARITSGLTATPQSTAHQTLWTLGSPSGPIETSAIWATKDPKLSTTATPRARPSTERALPACELGDRLEHAGGARMPVAHHREPALHRILPGGLQQLVDKALDGIAGMGVADRAPPQGRHADLGVVHLAAEIRDLVEDLVGPLDRRRVDAVLDHEGSEGRAEEEGLADERVRPGRDLAILTRRAGGARRAGGNSRR